MAVAEKMIDLATLHASNKAKLCYDRDYFETRNIEDALADITTDYSHVAIRPACLPRSPVVSPQSAVTSKIGLADAVATARAIQPSSDTDDNDEVSSGNNNPVVNADLIRITQIECTLRTYEEEERLAVQAVYEKKRSEFSAVTNNLSQQSSQNLEMVQGRRNLTDRMKEKHLQAKTQAKSVESKLRHQKLKDEHLDKALKSKQKLKEATQQDRTEKETEQRLLDFQRKIKAFAAQKEEVYASYQEIAASVKACLAPERLAAEVQDAVATINRIIAHIHQLVQGICTGHLNDADIETVASYREQAVACATVVKTGVEAVNANKDQQQQQVVVTPLRVSKPKSAIITEAPKQTTTNRSSRPHQQGTTTPLISAVFSEPLRVYASHVENVEQIMAACQDISSNPSMKKYRLELQKAITTPINAISSQSGSQLRDKVDRLLRFLSGQPPDGASRISFKDHPQGRLYCLDLLAKKFVKQGEEQVSAKHETAFPIATVILEIWLHHPDFGQLLLSHFYTKFSYLVPYVIQTEGQSELETKTALGYKVVDGVLEDTDMYLKRITGIVRLYAAIMQLPLPHKSNQPHPLGLGACWTLISYCVRMPPVPDVTATVLFNLLEVCGHAMLRQYRRQFHKVLDYVCRDYLAGVMQAGGASGPLIRLETLLQGYARSGRLPPPAGTLPDNFWST